MAEYAWMDRKVVMVMASNTQPLVIGSVLRQQKDHSRTPIPCPESSFCTISTWVVSIEVIFHFLFDVAITNSYILQKGFCSNSTFKNTKDYVLKLAMQLIRSTAAVSELSSENHPRF